MNNYSNGISVSALNRYIKEMMERDDFLLSVAVSGEISNFKRNVSGHLYFSLKDEGATVSAVMFRGAASRLTFIPRDGMKVTLWGRVSLYEKTGQYQVYAEHMVASGEGDLARAFEALKRKLEGEGLFSEQRKKPLPAMPRRIGIVTSPTGAAIRDMLNVTGRRYPLADIVIYPAAVQGAEAPAQLRAGIETFNALGSVDVIIIGRGGGSIEDLWAFNDEALARSVAASAIPVVSAVGHETDFTLCDFASDRRAPTPSAAAEIVVPDVSELMRGIENTDRRLRRSVSAGISAKTENVANLERILLLNSPASKLERSRLRVDNLRARLDSLATSTLRDAKSELGQISAKLGGMNPLAVLSRGYGAVENSEGRFLSSVSSLEVGQNINIVMSDGSVSADVVKISRSSAKRRVSERKVAK
ncbi:MAG: exodeoxyribonuclease VII large subunit [Clostridia bacterium]|nr:exodeoxyribonuclease VII large subunit [Clostridia bacterium]